MTFPIIILVSSSSRVERFETDNEGVSGVMKEDRAKPRLRIDGNDTLPRRIKSNLQPGTATLRNVNGCREIPTRTDDESHVGAIKSDFSRTNGPDRTGGSEYSRWHFCTVTRRDSNRL